MKTINRFESLRDTGYRFFDSMTGRKLASRPAVVGRQHVVYYFMGSSTCSRCWKNAMVLSKYYKQLRENNTAVVLVNDGRYQEPAAQLAAELKLPFPMLADGSGALRKRYEPRPSPANCPMWSLSLVDKEGAVRQYQEGCSPESKLNIFDLLVEIERTNARNQQVEPFVPVSGCCVPL
jgi:peroxiredoxin